MIDDAFFDYATRYLLIPGRKLSPLELPEAIGLAEPLPAALEGLFKLCDELGVSALVLSESETLLKQWNPYSGRWPLYTEGAFGAQLLNDHRWLQKIHEAGAKALHSALHELSHALWAAWGQLGLLSLLSPQERARFHLASEACAVLMSDLEGHEQLLSSGLLARYWPAAEAKSHAVAFSPVQALKEAGLASSQERAAWLFELYLQQQTELPQLSAHEGRRVEALAFLIEEASYAEKAELTVTPAWLRSYWERPEIEGYLRDFVPPRPLTLPQLEEPITSVEGCVAHWRELTLGAAQLSIAQRAYLRARLSTQRVALKVCELMGLFESYRLIISDELRAEALSLIHTTRASLLQRFEERLAQPLAELERAQSEALCDEAERALRELVSELSSRCGPCLCLEHPHLDRVAFTEHAPALSLSARELLAAGEGPRESGLLLMALRLVRDESKLYLKSHAEQRSASPRLSERLERAERRYHEAHRLLGALELEGSEALRAEVESWLNELRLRRELWLPYPLELSASCPFIDPLVGFRYQ